MRLLCRLGSPINHLLGSVDSVHSESHLNSEQVKKKDCEVIIVMAGIIKDLIVVGPGELGYRVACFWKRAHPEAKGAYLNDVR